MMNILMLAPLKEENFQNIEQAWQSAHFTYSPPHQVTQDMIDRSDMIIGNPPLSLNLHRERLKVLMLNSAGTDGYTLTNVLHPQTVLVNASGTYGIAISEHILAMILAINKNLQDYVLNMQKGLWQPIPRGKELYKSTVVIVGLGDLGYTVAKRLKAFDCHIIGIKRRTLSHLTFIDELYTSTALSSVLPRADFVIITLPQTPKTYHLFDKEMLMKMKQDAVLINVGRGSVIATQDLLDVLKCGHLYGVGLDVLEEEPLPFQHELWTLPNVLITPHAAGGYVWESARRSFSELVIRNLRHYQKGELLENVVDFQTGYRQHIDYR